MKLALLDLDLRCSSLSDEEKRRLSVGLLNCHLALSNRPTHPCAFSTPVSQCTATMDEPAFQLFTAFLQHTDSMCHHLQAEIWAGLAESSSLRLLSSATAAAFAVEQSHQLQQATLEGQTRLLALSQASLLNEQRLRAELDSASSKLSDARTRTPFSASASHHQRRRSS